MTTAAMVAGLLSAVFLVETLAAVIAKPAARQTPLATATRRSAVVVPAHNESLQIGATLAGLRSQLGPRDRLLVVADNCNDNTAALASAAGAEVIERCDPSRLGKGYALDYGLRHLRADPPDVVIIIDADCKLKSGSLQELARSCAETRRPAQALYLMDAPEDAEVDHRVAVFAFRVKNWVRPLGLHCIGLPCQLMGTGMAFRWATVGSVSLANGSVVEDLKLGLDFALTGNPPVFVPSANVCSQFPFSKKGTKTQRKRWEQGHLGIITEMVPRLLLNGIVRADVGMVALALDAAIPPLTLFAAFIFFMFALTTLYALFGQSELPFLISVVNLAGFGISIALSWWRFGRDILPPRAWLSIVSFVGSKLPIYNEFFSQDGHRAWIRTERGKEK